VLRLKVVGLEKNWRSARLEVQESDDVTEVDYSTTALIGKNPTEPLDYTSIY
jgi:hypothetical protein